jgi:hypothetical protein
LTLNQGTWLKQVKGIHQSTPITCTFKIATTFENAGTQDKLQAMRRCNNIAYFRSKKKGGEM